MFSQLLRTRAVPARIPSLSRSISSSPSLLLHKTPLYDFHTLPQHGGKMVEFAGFSMPLSYDATPSELVAGGPTKEHEWVRTKSGLFDVGHMVQTTYEGPGALKFLEKLLPAPLSILPVPKSDTESMKSTLSVLLNEEGGIIDDCMITRWGEDKFYLVTNAGRAERDMEWIEGHLKKWNEEHGDNEKVVMKKLPATEWGLVALQGPGSSAALSRLLSPSTSLTSLLFSSSLFLTLPSVSSSTPIHISRAGYTGEDGFEISVPASLTSVLAQALVDQPEVKLAGLAARDSLRLEAGLCLYGHDLDEGTGVGEAGLGWVVGKDRKETADFIGAERTLKELKKGGTTRKRVGLVVEKGAPAREGSPILSASGEQIGIVTSGLPSPSLKQNISMGYIETKDGLNKKGSQVMVEVRKKMRKAEVVGMPWIKPGYYRG